MKLVLMVLKFLRESDVPVTTKLRMSHVGCFLPVPIFVVVRFTIQVDGLSADGRHCNFARLLNTRSRANAGEEYQIVW